MILNLSKTILDAADRKNGSENTRENIKHNFPSKIKIKKTPDTMNLLENFLSEDECTSSKASGKICKFISDTADEVLPSFNPLDSFYESMVFGEEDKKVIPLPESDNSSAKISFSGGNTSEIEVEFVGADEFPVQFAHISSVVSCNKNRFSDLTALENMVIKAFNEITYKAKIMSIQPILHHIAQASKVFTSENKNNLSSKDWNYLRKMANCKDKESFSFLCSPGVLETIRAMSYKKLDSPENSTEKEKESKAIYAYEIIQMNEFGIGYDFNKIFEIFSGDNFYKNELGTLLSKFDNKNSEIAVAIQQMNNGLVKASLGKGKSKTVFNVSLKIEDEKVFLEISTDYSYISMDSSKIAGVII